MVHQEFVVLLLDVDLPCRTGAHVRLSGMASPQALVDRGGGGRRSINGILCIHYKILHRFRLMIG